MEVVTGVNEGHGDGDQTEASEAVIWSIQASESTYFSCMKS